MLYVMLAALSVAALLLFVSASRLSAAQVAALTEAAYYSALHPSWPQIYANGRSYAMLPEDAQRHGLRDGDEMPLDELANLLILCNEECEK